ncbi:YMGG-like glycine zipper-containing protein [Phyllobacterium ifriqiyense]|uniref:YMGG-like glycine zipper-containing protein n=1 Tax=Phyllobacterium ifriqiyense TaxID=314238 RepID=UPI0033924783
MHKLIAALFMVAIISGCTSTEKDVAIGTGAGAVIGGLAGGGKGALIGAGVGAVGGLLVRELEGGNCQYRGRNGQIYTAACKR